MVICTSEIWKGKVLWLIKLQLPSGNFVGGLKVWKRIIEVVPTI